MQRTLVSGVAACLLLLFVAPGPSQAAGVTRSAPYDFGVRCVVRDASFAVPPVGTGTPAGCNNVPDPAALAGRLEVREDQFNGGAAVIVQGFPNGGVGHAYSGNSQAAAGLNVRTGTGGGRLTAAAVLSGVTQATRVCLTITMAGVQGTLASSCTRAGLSATVENALANTNYTIQVTLYTPATSAITTPSPCPPSGLATCTANATWTAGGDSVTVTEMSYSLG